MKGLYKNEKELKEDLLKNGWNYTPFRSSDGKQLYEVFGAMIFVEDYKNEFVRVDI